MWSDRFRRQHRKNILTEVTVGRRARMRAKLHTGEGDERVSPQTHCRSGHAWSPERSDEFNTELYVVDFFFVPGGG